MTTDWQTWGLEPPSGSDRDRLVILGGGRGLVLGALQTRTCSEGTLDDRFSVSMVQVPRGEVTPERGDIVFWREHLPTRPNETVLWGGPTRVIREHGEADYVEVFCLEDAVLDSSTPDDTDVSFAEQDRVLDESELWSVLGWWGLNPFCPRCGGELLPIMYGLLSATRARA